MRPIPLSGFGSGTTQVILVRHAESGFNGQNRIQGHLDSGLTVRGKRQASKLAYRFKGIQVDRVYSSDLGRAMSTTKLVARFFKAPIVYDKKLREINLGAWEGLSPEEVNARFNNGYHRWRRSPSRMVIPGAERMKDFHRRVYGRLESIIKKEEGKRLVVVTHGGVIASLLSQWLDADFDRILLNIKLDNTGVTLLEKTPLRMKIHAINDVSHLEPDDINDLNVFTQSH